MEVHSALLFESVEEMYARVFRRLRPRSRTPVFEVRFCRFANPDSFVEMRDGRATVRISDLLEGAPAPVMEALAFILLGKAVREPVPARFGERLRRYLNRRDVRRTVHLVRQQRGRKLFDPPRGTTFDLEELFEDLNFRFFHGLMARPVLGWSRRPSRTLLGHYDLSHNSIVISRIMDRPGVPRLAVEYVLYHEMLHLRYPILHQGSRRSIHTREFREAERQFPNLEEAKALLKKLGT